MKIRPKAILTPTPDVIKRHDVFLIDNYGVLKRGNSFIAGVAKTFHEIERQGKRAILVSNTGDISVTDLGRQLAAQGISLAEENIVTSGRVLMPYFAHHGLLGSRVLCIGNEASAKYVEAAGGKVLSNNNIINRLGEIDVVVVGMIPVSPGGDGNFGPIGLETINAAINVLMMRRAVPGLILNPDVLVPFNDASVVLGTGAIGKLIEDCSGRLLERLGKPFKPIFELALSLVPNVQKGQVVMVGDSLAYDVAGAINAGIRSWLVMTGNTKDLSEVDGSEVKPDYISESFAIS